MKKTSSCDQEARTAPLLRADSSRSLVPWPVSLQDLYLQTFDYGIDFLQRSFLFLDILRQRGNAYFEQNSSEAPNVLNFETELLVDGRALPSPVNYLLLRILPPDGATTDPGKRPFIVFDPRAGQGPGIGGMKKDSEIGIALERGHPVYFVSFLSLPAPGQTIEDVCAAQACFIEHVIARHPLADKPCLIGNCQAGWQIALTSSLHPEMPGVLILAAAPLSYWAGKRGASVVRYAAGITGGSWIDAFLSDLGGGLFDGAWLVFTFENNNPAQAYWQKLHDLYVKIDTEGPRYLRFEKWWGTPVFLGGEEMQFIADELFIGNRLATAKIHTSSGLRADLRNIKTPMVIFCSRGDDITPPAQALGWILDLYNCDDDLLAGGQTIIYCLHESVGHLGIFVSSKVAAKEHKKFIDNIDMIESLPPGLYEAVFVPKTEDSPNASLISGSHILSFERRGLADIRAFGFNTPEDDRRFAAVARLSENIQGLYFTFLSPIVRALVSKESAALLRAFHPVRAPFAFFSDKNPLVKNLCALTEPLRANRKEIPENNFFWQAQENFSRHIGSALKTSNEMKNAAIETVFLSIYGQPLLQAQLGLLTVRPYVKPSAARDVVLERERNKRIVKALRRIDTGGLAEAMVRGLLYIGRSGRAIDEREYITLARLTREASFLPALSREAHKAIVRQQYWLLLLDEARALETIPLLLDRAEGKEREALAAIRRIVESSGKPTPEQEERLKKLEQLFVPAHAPFCRRATDTPPSTPPE